MAIFQVSSRTVQPPGPPKKRPRRVHQRWYAVLRRLTVGGLIIAALATLLGKLGLSSLFFILLPVCVSILTARSYLYNRNMFLLTTGLALIYFGAVTGWELLTHRPGTSEIIVVTTTLALAVLFEPARARVQSFMEQRFHLRDDEAIKAVEAFNSTLREEIDLDQLRERLFAVVQETMQPQSISVWVREVMQNDRGNPLAQAGWGEKGSQAQREEYQREMQTVPDPVADSFHSIMHSEVNVADNDPIIIYALSHPGAVEVDRLQLDSPVLHNLKTNGVEIALPLASQGELIGLLNLGPHLNGQEYTHEDRALLNTLAAQVAPALRVAQMVYLRQVRERERERIEQELRTAQDIQHSLLPKDVPLLPGWQIAPYYQPAREVGGDFYDFLPFANGRLGLVIGDVTDKGIPAALVMVTTHTMLRTVAQEHVSPGEALARVNELLYAEIPSRMFVTCFYAILDPGNGRMRYANAGHELPYRRHSDSVSELRATGMPLGMMPGSSYEEREVTLASGESVLFYSDGLVEAHNTTHEMFDYSRLSDLIEAHPGGPTLIEFLLSELATFTGEHWEQEDDLTMVTLSRGESC